jgi:hypothetical protein
MPKPGHLSFLSLIWIWVVLDSFMTGLVVYLEERERERGCSDRGDESVCETDALVVTHRCRR